jgi:proton glutamate symport protein
MTLNARVLLSLGVGLGTGAVLARADPTLAARVSDVVAPVGALWVNGLLMLVMPLVLASLVVGVASAADLRVIGRLGRKAAASFLVVTTASAVLSILVVPPVMAWLTVDRAAAASLLASAGGAAPSAGEIQTAGQWVAGLLPANAVKTAAEGRLLPLVLFTVLFAVALTRLPRPRAAPVVELCHGIVDALRVLVGWILVLAPIGVFALSLPIAVRLGAAVVGSIGFYLALMAVLCTLGAIAMYPLAWFGGGVPMREFARAVAPAQSVAFASRSSLASLPALLEGARARLKLPEPVTAFVLPLAVSAFKISAPIEFFVASYFLAKLYGVPIAASQLPLVFVQAILLSFAVPGIIFGAVITMAPMLVTLGIPLQGLGLLLAVDMVADGFRSAVNATADLAVATVVARGAAMPPDVA